MKDWRWNDLEDHNRAQQRTAPVNHKTCYSARIVTDNTEIPLPAPDEKRNQIKRLEDYALHV